MRKGSNLVKDIAPCPAAAGDKPVSWNDHPVLEIR